MWTVITCCHHLGSQHLLFIVSWCFNIEYVLSVRAYVSNVSMIVDIHSIKHQIGYEL